MVDVLIDIDILLCTLNEQIRYLSLSKIKSVYILLQFHRKYKLSDIYLPEWANLLSYVYRSLLFIGEFPSFFVLFNTGVISSICFICCSFKTSLFGIF